MSGKKKLKAAEETVKSRNGSPFAGILDRFRRNKEKP